MAKNKSMVRAAAALPVLSSDDPVAATAVLEFQSPTLTLITTPPPFSARMTSWAIGSLVIVTFILFALVPIDRVVATVGVVLSQTPNVIVQPLETAIVRKIYVRDGQQVKKGELLAELDPTFAASDEKSTVDQKLSLQAQVNRLRAELADKPYLSDGTQYGQLEELAYLQRHQQFVFTMEDYDQKINSLQAKVDSAAGDIAGYQKRLANLKSVEAMRRELERLSVGSKLNTAEAVDQVIQIQISLEDAQHAHDGALKDLAAQKAERDAWAHQWYSDTQTLEATQERSLSDMNGQSVKNTLRHDLVQMRAEADSIVLDVSRVSPGTVLQAGTQLMTTVPVDTSLQVVALIDGSDSGFVAPNDTVSLKFDTLPYNRYGQATGHVVRISQDSFTDPAAGGSNPLGTTPVISTQAPQNTGTAPVYYYRALISIDKLDLRHTPASFRVMPGMPMQVDIRVGQRTILAYMLDKVVPFLSEGMREPT